MAAIHRKTNAKVEENLMILREISANPQLTQRELRALNKGVFL